MHRRWNVIAGRASIARNPALAAVEPFEALHPAGQKATDPSLANNNQVLI